MQIGEALKSNSNLQRIELRVRVSLFVVIFLLFQGILLGEQSNSIGDGWRRLFLALEQNKGLTHLDISVRKSKCSLR